MPLPDTFVELALAGYHYQGSGHCKACGVRLEWFLTPKLHRIPFSGKQQVIVGEDTIRSITSDVKIEPHFATCPQAEQFRRKK